MIIDKSAILAILNMEEDAAAYAKALEESDVNIISAVSYFELAAYIERKYGDAGARELDNFMKKANISIYPVDEKIIELARDGYRFFGRGKAGSGVLGLSDCFAYGLAKFLNETLLFKSEQFRNTDVTSAI